MPRRASRHRTPVPSTSPEQALLDAIGPAFTDAGPLTLPLLASTVAMTLPDAEAADALVRGLLDLDDPRAGDLAAAVGLLVPAIADGPLGRAVEDTLRARGRETPPAVAALREARPVGAMRLLADRDPGENLIVGFEVDGEPLTWIAFVEHAAGHALRDAMPVPESLDAVWHQMVAFGAADEGVRRHDIPLDEAHARLLDALQRDATRAQDGAPRYEDETWPSSLPLLLFTMTRLPEPGPAPEWADRSVDELCELAAAIAADQRLDGITASMVEEIAIGIGQSAGDPLDWTPEQAVSVLVDVLPNTPCEDEELAVAPDAMRAMVRYAATHAEVTDPDLVLAAIDGTMPRYRALLADPQLAVRRAALIQEVDYIATIDPFDENLDPQDVLDQLANRVGGFHVLDLLDDAPLTLAPLELDGIDPEYHALAHEIDGHLTDVVPGLLGDEALAASRWLLAAALAGSPRLVARGKARNTAAAVAEIVAETNGMTGYGGRMSVTRLREAFRVGSPQARVPVILDAADVPRSRDQMTGQRIALAGELLVADVRGPIVAARDTLRAAVGEGD